MELRENLARLKRTFIGFIMYPESDFLAVCTGRKLGQDTPPPTEHSSSEEEEEEETVVRPRGRRLYKPIPGARPSQPTLQEWMDGSDDDEPQVEASRSPSPSKGEEESGSSDNDSWIEDDTNNGATSAILPEGYSMLGHQSLAHHFKVVMQFFVYLACLKAKKRSEFIQDEQNGKVYIPHHSVPGYLFRPERLARSVFRLVVASATQKNGRTKG
jgi:hypothetical protein